MDNFLEIFNVPRLNHEKIEILNTPITSIEIESVTQNLPTDESLRPDGFTGDVYQNYQEELIIILLNLFPPNKRGNTSKLIL